MSGTAIVMMLVAIAIIWGGLALAILNIARFKGEEPEVSQRDL